MTLEYVPLHVHTDASLDGAGTVTSLVAEAKRIGLKALAMTDHGTLANAVAFWSACTDVEIKPILGLEAYLLYQGNRHHITLLSLNETGFNNLIALDTWSHVENHVGGYPLITLDKLYTLREGLFALSGCASSALYSEHGNVYVSDLFDVMATRIPGPNQYNGGRRVTSVGW
jgi:DNA polymerase-3 subunit alpha